MLNNFKTSRLLLDRCRHLMNKQTTKSSVHNTLSSNLLAHTSKANYTNSSTSNIRSPMFIGTNIAKQDKTFRSGCTPKTNSASRCESCPYLSLVSRFMQLWKFKASTAKWIKQWVVSRTPSCMFAAYNCWPCCFCDGRCLSFPNIW